MPIPQNNGGQPQVGGGKKAHFVRFKQSNHQAVRVRSSAEIKADNIIKTVSATDELQSDGAAVNGWYSVTLADGRKGYISADVVELDTTKPESKPVKRGEVLTRIDGLITQLLAAIAELRTLN